MVKQNSKAFEAQKKAESSMKGGNFTAAFFHWTHAIKLEPDEPSFYYERSKCFLQQEQYYFALLDAETLIRLNPQNPQGYSRKAEIFYATGNYTEALPLIQKCFTLSNDKEHFMDWSKRCKREHAKQEALRKQYPFVGAAVGIILSTLLVVWDYFTYGSSSFMVSPILKVGLIVAFSMVCYFLAGIYRRHTDNMKGALLQPPLDLFGDDRPHSD